MVVSVVFLLIHLVPGDPVVQMLGEGATASDISALRHAYGLDAPLGTQYLHYWRGVLHGDLGQSLRLHDSVTHLVLQRYPYTLALTLAALLIGIAALHPRRRLLRAASRPLAGPPPRRRLARRPVLPQLRARPHPDPHLLHPARMAACLRRRHRPHLQPAVPRSISSSPPITLGSGLAGILTRMVRTAMLEELGQDYIRTARAKGLPERRVVYRHALANALIPVLTVIGLQFGSLLSGAIVTETVFSWPGIGRLTLSAISNRDYALVQGCILAVGLTYVAVNLLTDVAYTLANPRISA